MTKITAAQMGKNSWAAKVKRMGLEEAIKDMKAKGSLGGIAKNKKDKEVKEL